MKIRTSLLFCASCVLITLLSSCAAPASSDTASTVTPGNYAQPTPHHSAAQTAASMISPVTH